MSTALQRFDITVEQTLGERNWHWGIHELMMGMSILSNWSRVLGPPH